MPTISMFYGVIVRMYHWIEIHQDELMANWQLAVSGEPIFKIEPLR